MLSYVWFFHALPAQATVRKVLSTVVQLGDSDVAYYMHSPALAGSNGNAINFGSGQVVEPCTVISIDCGIVDRMVDETTDGMRDEKIHGLNGQDQLHRTLSRFAEMDDVWTSSFLESLVIQSANSRSGECSLALTAQDSLRQKGVKNFHYSQWQSIPQGPYFLNNGSLHQAYRLYPDTAGAFIVATVPADSSGGTFRSLDASAYGEQYPSSLTVAVPSRLGYRNTSQKPFAGARIAIKDIMDLKGLKTGSSSRAYTSLYPVRSASAEVVQSLIDLGFVVVGKLKTTQFADSEWPTCDWVDYHAPFNPRGDGYLTTSGSSAGSAAAVASYEWLDFSLGTDTLGSIRAPAAAQGIFGIRPSLGGASFKGIVPYSPKFDTVGGFARTASELNDLVRALYGTHDTRETRYKLPSSLLYPTDYWPAHHEESQAVFEDFITDLERYLGVKRTEINLGDIWEATRPEGVTEPLAEYLEHVFEWGANPDQWSGFFKQFVEDYESERGEPPVLNPQLRFKRNYLPTVTPDQQAEAVQRLAVYQHWFYQNIMPPSNDGQSDSVLVLPWTNGQPTYRNTYKDRPQNFTGIGFFFYNVGTYAEAPEIIVPVAPTHYKSPFTGKTEELPAAIGLVGAKGRDLMLAELVSGLQAHRDGAAPSVSDGQTQDPLVMDYVAEDL